MSEGCDMSETLLAIARFDDERRDHELRDARGLENLKRQGI